MGIDHPHGPGIFLGPGDDAEYDLLPAHHPHLPVIQYPGLAGPADADLGLGIEAAAAEGDGLATG